jgi:hypothetical protein
MCLLKINLYYQYITFNFKTLSRLLKSNANNPKMQVIFGLLAEDFGIYEDKDMAAKTCGFVE